MCKRKKKPKPPPPPDVVRAPCLIGYAAMWNPQPADVDRYAEAGCTLMMVEWSGPDFMYDFPRVKAIIERARARDLTTMVILYNWNRKGDPDTGWIGLEAFREKVRELKTLGIDRLWLEGVSEPDTSEDAMALDRIVWEEWPGQIVVNVQGGSGSGRHVLEAPSGVVLDYHHCDFDRALELIREHPEWLHSTDCTPMLPSSAPIPGRGGDPVGGIMTPDDIRLLVRTAIDARAMLFLYDAFVLAPNRDVVGYVREAISGTSPPPPDPAAWAWDVPEYFREQPASPLVALDWGRLPAIWQKAGWPDGSDKELWWVFSRLVWPIDLPAGSEGHNLTRFQAMQGDIFLWWQGYVLYLVSLMERYSALQLTIATNDAADNDETTVELREGTLKLIPENLHSRITDRDRLGHPHPEWYS